MSFASAPALTVTGMQQLHGDLLALRERRSSLAEVLAASPEDPGIDLQTELIMADRRIAEIASVLARARPIDAGERIPGVVGIGSMVTVQWDLDGEETYTIVDPAEISPSEGRISDESPVGQALFGQRVGERVVVGTIAGPTWLTIVAVD
jgi:transcription elongation factor GreA